MIATQNPNDDFPDLDDAIKQLITIFFCILGLIILGVAYHFYH